MKNHLLTSYFVLLPKNNKRAILTQGLSMESVDQINVDLVKN